MGLRQSTPSGTIKCQAVFEEKKKVVSGTFVKGGAKTIERLRTKRGAPYPESENFCILEGEWDQARWNELTIRDVSLRWFARSSPPFASSLLKLISMHSSVRHLPPSFPSFAIKLLPKWIERLAGCQICTRLDANIRTDTEMLWSLIEPLA